jgi:NAD(P)-dependent dehydrogenase (short-subunit alcohol dehydrogenase family)
LTRRRTAIVTGASSGIGLAIALVLAEEGHDLTIAARGRDRLNTAAGQLRALGAAVEVVEANMASEHDIVQMVAHHRTTYGALDVLANNAGLGIRGPIDGFETKHIDLLLAVNLRAVLIAYRETVGLLRQSGAEHGQALVINTASISGKVGSPDLAVYSAAKHGVVGFTDAMNRELYEAGVRSCVLCPGFVDTPLSDYAKGHVPKADMIQTGDIGEAVRLLLHLSPACVIPEIVFLQGEALGLPRLPLAGTAAADGNAAGVPEPA